MRTLVKQMKWVFPIIVTITGLACGPSAPPQYWRTMPLETHSYRYLALGDSYTIGESVEEMERWPVQLAMLIAEKRIDILMPTIIAKTGWTTDELDAAIDREKPTGPFDIVSLLIGVNNQYRSRSPEEYREQFKGLLQRAIGFAGSNVKRVIVLSIPDWGVTPFAKGRNVAKIAQEIDRFNAINREEAGRAGAHYIDVTPVSREATQDASLIALDGLHPSDKMYAEWARLALPKALEALGWRK